MQNKSEYLKQNNSYLNTYNPVPLIKLFKVRIFKKEQELFKQYHMYTTPLFVRIFKTEQKLFKRYLKTTKYLTLDGYNIIYSTAE